MRVRALWQCDKCGYTDYVVYDDSDMAEIVCPECGESDMILNGHTPLLYKKGLTDKCKSCPFTLLVCQECEYALDS